MRQLVRPRTLARRPLTALKRQFPLALEGRVTGVHQARVASRRLRELLPVLAPSAHAPHVRKLRRDIRELTRALGPVRELDVALESLGDLAGRMPAEAEALAHVRVRLERERAGAAAQLDRLCVVDVDRLGARVLELVPERPSSSTVRRTAARIAERIGERGRALDHAVDACGTLFSMAQLHGARIALKKFRYALELGEQIGRFRLKATLGRLKDLQDQLGHLHDLYVLAARIRDCACADAASRQRLEVVALTLDEEMRRLHCVFLTDRQRLRPVLAVARRVRLQLGVLAVRMSPAPAGRGSAPLQRQAG